MPKTLPVQTKIPGSTEWEMAQRLHTQTIDLERLKFTSKSIGSMTSGLFERQLDMFESVTQSENVTQSETKE